MPTRQTVVKPLGLITRPNEYGVYQPGAMAVADNLLFRDVGEMQVSKDIRNTVSVAAANDVMRKLFPMDSGIIWNASRTAGNVWSMRFDASSAAVPTAFSTTSMLSDVGFIYPLRMRDHFQVNATQGMLVSDVMAPASAADRTFRQAGMPQVEISTVTSSTTNAGAVAANTQVGYCLIQKRVFANGYEVVSTPSVVYRFPNDATTVNVTLRVVWHANAGILAGDIIELYRTDAVSSAASDTGTTCKLVLSYTLTAADIIAGFVDLTDTQAPGALGVTYGRELYTNPGQGGALAANRQANVSKLTASYKGYAFYANVTERPLWSFQVPAGVSGSSSLSTAYERQYGIGKRSLVGAGATVTAGSAVITAVAAADMVGIKVGQIMTFDPIGAFAANSTIIAVGANTITMSSNSGANFVGYQPQFADRFQLDGVNFTVGDFSSIFLGIGATGAYEMTCDQTVRLPTPAGVFAPAAGFTVTVEPIRPAFATSMTIRATNGANYQPPVPEWTASVKTFTQTPRPNMLQWSHPQQPEHVPPSNSAFIGAGVVVGLQSTRDALWIFCTDGLFRLSGDAGQWRIDQLDTTLILSAPQCATALRDAVYAYTNRGLLRIADDGFDELSEVTVGDLLPGTAYYETAALIVERDEANDEIHLIDTGVSGGAPTQYLYSTRAQAWSKLTFANVTALAYQRIPTNPATQANGWLIIGQSPQGGLTPRYSSFDQGAANTLTATAQYQPFYEADPMQLKQWIDATWVFGLADATRTIASSWSGVADGSNTLTAQLNGDARATFGVPRSVAVAPTISPGISIPAGAFAGPVCKGVSLRYQSLTEQQAYR